MPTSSNIFGLPPTVTDHSISARNSRKPAGLLLIMALAPKVSDSFSQLSFSVEEQPVLDSGNDGVTSVAVVDDSRTIEYYGIICMQGPTYR